MLMQVGYGGGGVLTGLSYTSLASNVFVKGEPIPRVKLNYTAPKRNGAI